MYTKYAKFLGIIKNLPPHYYDDGSWTRTSPIGQRDLLPVIFIFSTIWYLKTHKRDLEDFLKVKFNLKRVSNPLILCHGIVTILVLVVNVFEEDTTINHTWYLSQTPQTCLCKKKLPGVNFYRFNAKNWHFRQILREKVAFFFTDLTWKIGVFRCKFYYPKILPV